MKVFILLNIFVLSCLSVSAQTGTLSGKVVDKVTGEPLIGANVIIKELNIGAATDVDGSYKISYISPGSYLIKVSYIGYKTFQIDNARIVAYECQLNFELENGDPNDIILHKKYIPKNLTNAFIIPVRPFDLPIKGIYYESIIEKIKTHPLQIDSIKMGKQ